MEKHDKVKRMSAIDLFSSIVMGTPVEKGVLRGAWFATISKATNQKGGDELADKEGDTTIQRLEQVINSSDAMKDIFFTNNMDYAVPIEFDGISAKAERGMVRINVRRWKNIVKNNIRLVNSGR